MFFTFYLALNDCRLFLIFFVMPYAAKFKELFVWRLHLLLFLGFLIEVEAFSSLLSNAEVESFET